MENFKECASEIIEYLNALQKLYDQNVLLNKQSFTAQIGEWLVAPLYVGYKYVNRLSRTGFSAWWVQDFQQNRLHQSSWFKPGNTSPYVVPTNDNLRLSH